MSDNVRLAAVLCSLAGNALYPKQHALRANPHFPQKG